jgi:hypothetical protein
VTQHGIDGQTLRKLLVAAGLIDPKAPGSNSKIALSSEDMDAIIARWRDRLSRLDAMDRLGVDGAVLKKLAAAGLIKMTPRQHGLDPAYSSSSIESLIAAIDGVATADPNAKSMSTLKGSGLTKTFAQIIALILEGKLTAGISKHPPEATKLSDIRIDASALKAVPTDICLADWMPFANVKVLLKTSTAGISGLESIDEFAPPRTYISGNRAIHRFYPRASIVGFHKTYVSYDRLSKRRAFAVNPEALLASYEPAFDFGGRDRFYRRSDLAI